MSATTAKNSFQKPERISAAEKEQIISDFFKKKADKMRIFLEKNPVPEHLLSRNKKPRNS
jgi:hypothetical protein